MDDNLIKISSAGSFCCSCWSMVIDLRELAQCAGKRIRDGYQGGSFVDYPLPRAKKLLKLIREYGDPDDFWKVEEQLKGNKKLMIYWNEGR